MENRKFFLVEKDYTVMIDRNYFSFGLPRTYDTITVLKKGDIICNTSHYYFLILSDGVKKCKSSGIWQSLSCDRRVKDCIKEIPTIDVNLNVNEGRTITLRKLVPHLPRGKGAGVFRDDIRSELLNKIKETA